MEEREMKMIREARMGRPKTFKSGAILSSYPKPMLYYGLDRGGVDVVPSKNIVLPPDYIQPDTRYEDIKHIKPTDFATVANLPMEQQARITAVDFTLEMPTTIDLSVKPMASQLQLQRFTEVHNATSQRPTLPWKTIVLDGATGLTDAVLAYISSTNPNAMTDARQWAGQAGAFVRKTILAMTALPCHFVCILHSQVDANPDGTMSEQPSVYSQVLRDDFFGLFSQVFYAFKDPITGLPFIRVSDEYPVRGIGPRWPLGLAKVNKPDFNSIYGRELQG